jgi:acetylornithine deacetylase/succinyl-diaminopimelate desuccinylase-like protein
MHHLYSQYFEYLSQLLAFKSISTDKAYLPEIKKTVSWLTQFAKSQGWSQTLLGGKETNPVVVMKAEVDANLPTVIVYGHYDVQPAAEESWESDAWTLTERNGRLYARGVVDNKGQFLIHLVSVCLQKQKTCLQCDLCTRGK